MRERILIVTASPDLAADAVDKLRWGDYRPTWSATPDKAFAAATSECDLLVVDAQLGEPVVLAFIERVREGSDVPILLSVDPEEEGVRVAALRAGADAVVEPTASVQELLARAEALLRRPALRRAGPVTVGDLVIDLAARRCTVSGSDVTLTRAEFDLLSALILRRGATVTRQWLAANVLHDRMKSAERNLDAHVSHLRRKLGTAADVIETVRGAGYRLASADEPSTPNGT